MRKYIAFLLLLSLSYPAVSQRNLTDTLMGLHHHKGDITQAVYSMDGRRLISGSSDRQVYYFEAINWIELFNYSHNATVTQVAISRDNAIIASASSDNVLKVYFLDSSKMLEFEQESPITGIVFDFGMRFLYTASSDGFIRPYDLKKGEYTKRKYAAGMPISAISVTQNNFILAGLKNGEIKVMNHTGQITNTLKGHKGEITALSFLFYQNNMRIASASNDNIIKIWDAKTFKELKTITGHTWTITSLEISRDMRYLVSSSKDGSARVWDMNTGENLLIISEMGEAVSCASIGENSEYIATAHLMRDPREYVVYIWETGLKPETPAKPTPKKK